MTNKHKELEELVYKGLKDKNLPITDAVLDRITCELNVVKDRGFSEYFVLYSRIIEICNELGFLRSYGRGSAMNSLINYCLDITKLNPLDYDLIFERFIGPNSNQSPDIDIDIPKGCREIVINKLKQKFPEYNIFSIAYLTKRDFPSKDIVYNNIVYKKNPTGIVITTEPISGQTFTFEGEEFYLSLDFSTDLLFRNKIDILELEVLNRLQLIIDKVGEDYHPYKLPLNDKEVYELFSFGDKKNIFQFDACGFNYVFPRFKPESIRDLTIANACYRPGLLDSLFTIVRNKNAPEEIILYSDVRVNKILSETYGELIYQETFLQLLNEITGINFTEAEVWRRKLRSKDTKSIEEFSAFFKKGCIEHSRLTLDDIELLLNKVIEISPILFLKSHSLCYAIVGYWGAYYKRYFKLQFEEVFGEDVKNES